jgi:hypothetical protein
MASFVRAIFIPASLIATITASSVAASADRWVDDGRSIKAIGNGKFFVGDCMDKSVRLTGDRQQITLLGTCKNIVSRGNGNRIVIDGSSSLRVVGDDNVVTWKAKPNSVTVVGRNNTLSGH